MSKNFATTAEVSTVFFIHDSYSPKCYMVELTQCSKDHQQTAQSHQNTKNQHDDSSASLRRLCIRPNPMSQRIIYTGCKTSP